MKLRKILKELVSMKLEGNSLIAFSGYAGEYFARKEIQHHFYKSVGNMGRNGIVLREFKRLKGHDYKGVMTVDDFFDIAKNEDPNADLFIYVDGYMDKTPIMIGFIKTYVRTLKGNAPRSIVEFSVSDFQDTWSKKISLKKQYKVVYITTDERNVITREELIGYTNSPDSAIWLIKENIEMPEDIDKPRNIRKLTDFIVTECMIPVEEGNPYIPNSRPF